METPRGPSLTEANDRPASDIVECKLGKPKDKMIRRLAAILAADVVGYSRLTEVDEFKTHKRLMMHRAEVLDPGISDHRGHIVHTAGDGILVEFASVVDALECAIEIQRQVEELNREESRDQALTWRIGINIGDVIVDGNDVYGDGVNVAARLEGLAEPGGVYISEAVFAQVKNKVDATFESLGKRKVKNIAEPIHVFRVNLGTKSTVQSSGISRQTAWRDSLDKPAIAVLPFANMMPNQEKQYLVDGLVEDLITDLAMFPEFYVAARTSSFAYRHEQLDARELAARLGVRYVIEGSMQQDEQRVRITVQLIDAESGAHLWAERYDQANAELFEVRDEITRSIAATLMTTSGLIAKAEIVRRAMKPPANFTVYDHYMRARDYFHRSILPPWHEGKASSALAKQAFQIALEESAPPYWPAFAGLAWQHAIDFDWGYCHDPELSAQLALENAIKAVRHCPDDYMGHWVLGWAYLFAKHDHERAITQYETAHSMNSGDSRLLAEMAQPLIYMERVDEAVAKLKQAIRLNPFHEQWYDEFLGWAYEEIGQPELTISVLNRLVELEGLWSHAVLALAYAQTDRLEEFRHQAEIIDAMTREQFDERFTTQFWRNWVEKKNPYKTRARADRIVEIMSRALERAGMEV